MNEEKHRAEELQQAEELVRESIAQVLWGCQAYGESLMDFLEKHETDGQPLSDGLFRKFTAQWVFLLAQCNDIPVKEPAEKYFNDNLFRVSMMLKRSVHTDFYKLCDEKGMEEAIKKYKEKISDPRLINELKIGYLSRQKKKKSLPKDLKKFINNKLYKKCLSEIDQQKDRDKVKERDTYPKKKYLRTVYKLVMSCPPYNMTASAFAREMDINRKSLEGFTYDFLADTLEKKIREKMAEINKNN